MVDFFKLVKNVSEKFERSGYTDLSSLILELQLVSCTPGEALSSISIYYK